MKNDVEHGRVLRLVHYRNKYKLFWAELDEEGDVEWLLKDEDIDFSFKSMAEMSAMIALVNEAKAAACIHINNQNATDWFGEG